MTKKETSFATLARLYSEDKGTARQGGELGYTGRGLLDPAFANAAFNLTDPNKISKIVETEFGYHIIQLIDRRGDKVNVRHILLRPRVSEASLTAAEARLDSIADDIRAGKFEFGAATAFLSDDKDTKANHGVMVNSNESSRFLVSSNDQFYKCLTSVSAEQSFSTTRLPLSSRYIVGIACKL